ncbi:MAG: YvcK family protein [Candidatus Pacebacteria bacterium]|nr:YvcK family protein [Candidatus Paceibacterota bacterium]MDD3969720.1 YvcK family protein [Candidatus Paceibacterota bacterium]
MKMKFNFFSNKNIVCIGGGNAMPKVVLRGLKNKNVNLTVVSAVLDSGGSSGKLRKEYDIISPGDVRRAFLELCNLPEEEKKLLDFRFPEGELSSHNLGNLFFAASYLKNKKYRGIFERMNSCLIGNHKILPSTISKSDLVAILENGEEIVGEANIDVPKHNPNLKIKKLFLNPPVGACPQTLRRIKNADIIIIGPGDIFSSLMQVLLVDGMINAIKNSKAKKVYIANLMTKNGESNNFSVKDFVWEIENCLNSKLDYIIYNNNMASKEMVDDYRKENPQFLEIVDFSSLPQDNRYIGSDLLGENGIVHDSEKVAQIILKICKQ